MICLFNIAFLTYLGYERLVAELPDQGKGIHLEHAGYLSSLPFIAMLLGEVLGAWLSDKLDRRALACFLSLCGAGLGLAVVLHLQGTYSVIAAMAFSTFMWAPARRIFSRCWRRRPAARSALPPAASLTGWAILPVRWRRC